MRALNALGFTVNEIDIQPTPDGDKLRLRVMVADRNFHRNQIFGLTGLIVEERQAHLMMNEIIELQATLSRDNNRSIPLSVAAYYWLEHIYQPVVKKLESHMAYKSHIRESISPAELYCQVLEHKWYLSERAQRDVGHQAAVDDYLQKFSQSTLHPC